MTVVDGPVVCSWFVRASVHVQGIQVVVVVVVDSLTMRTLFVLEFMTRINGSAS